MSAGVRSLLAFWMGGASGGAAAAVTHDVFGEPPKGTHYFGSKPPAPKAKEEPAAPRHEIVEEAAKHTEAQRERLAELEKQRNKILAEQHELSIAEIRRGRKAAQARKAKLAELTAAQAAVARQIKIVEGELALAQEDEELLMIFAMML